MAVGKARAKAAQDKAARKRERVNHPSGESRYGRKARYLARTGQWGFDVAEPKPWQP